MPAKIISCSCYNSWQDFRYGEGKRVHTEGERVWRCTVCKNEKPKEREGK